MLGLFSVQEERRLEVSIARYARCHGKEFGPLSSHRTRPTYRILSTRFSLSSTENGITNDTKTWGTVSSHSRPQSLLSLRGPGGSGDENELRHCKNLVTRFFATLWDN